MQLKRDIEYRSSQESLDCLGESPMEWPLDAQYRNKLVVACNTCFYPITFEEHILCEIRDENNIPFGIVILMKRLFKKVGVFADNQINQWRTEVFCPNCGLILSFLSPHRNEISLTNFAKIIHFGNSDEEFVILWTRPLFRGSASRAYNCFIPY